jgi:hypothetical protein
VFFISSDKYIPSTCLVSPASFTFILIGVFKDLFRTASQFTSAKKGWDFIDYTPPRFGEPNLSFGFFVNS